MSYETEEQQVEQLKAWWSENGTPLIVGAVLGLAGFAGWKFWNEKQIAYQAAASDSYLKVGEIVASGKNEGLEGSAQAVKANFPKSSYSVLSAFHLAKAAVEAKDYSKAAKELNWIITNHSDNELVTIAKIRLARILIQQEKAADALPLVTLEEDSGYYALASLVKGDALLALERNVEALAAFKIASNDLEVVARHPSLAIKIESLGGAEVEDNKTSEAVTEEAK